MLLWRFIPVSQSHSQAIKANGLESTLLVLGASAVVFNCLFLIMLVYRTIKKQPVGLPGWIIMLNLAVLLLQVSWLISR